MMETTQITFSMNPAKAAKLDEVLVSFDSGDYLKREKILALFDADETLASEYMHILCSLNYVKAGAQASGQKLAHMFVKQKGTDMFISEGGFVGRYNSKFAESQQQMNREQLEMENLRLQNEALTYQGTIRDQELIIRNLDEKNKRFELLKNFEWLIRLGIALVSGILVWYYLK